MKHVSLDHCILSRGFPVPMFASVEDLDLIMLAPFNPTQVKLFVLPPEEDVSPHISHAREPSLGDRVALRLGGHRFQRGSRRHGPLTCAPLVYLWSPRRGALSCFLLGGVGGGIRNPRVEVNGVSCRFGRVFWGGVTNQERGAFELEGSDEHLVVYRFFFFFVCGKSLGHEV